MIISDLRFAARTLLKRPGFTAVAAGTLALGIGATTAIFSVANGVLLQALPYPDAERIVVLWAEDRTELSGELRGLISHPDLEDVRAQARTLEAVAQAHAGNLPLTGLGPAEMVSAGNATPEFFRVFGQELVRGRSFTEQEDQPGGPDVVVIGETFWRERLGAREEALGSTLQLAGRSFEIVGIAPASFDYPRGSQLWVPLKADDVECRGCVNSVGVALLATGATLEEAAVELAAIGRRIEAAEIANTEAVANLTILVASLQSVIVGDVRTAILVLLGAVGMVLLIACANVANLVLVRGASRRTEIAVRTALGAGRRRILSQLMAENVVLAALGAVGGLVLATWGVAGLKALAPADLPRMAEVGLDGATLAFALALALATVLLFGLAPALRVAGAGVADTLRQGGRSGGGDRRGNRLRTGVLVAEVALSVLLLLGAGLMLRSLARMHAVDLGIRTENVVHFRLSLPSARYGPEEAVLFLERLDERLERIPGVQRASAAVALPFTTTNIFGGFTRPERPAPPPGESPTVDYRFFDADVLDVLGVEVVRGRGFTAADRHDAQPVALINERMAAEFWPGEDPVGQQLQSQVGVGFGSGEPRTIVGIVRDFRRAVVEPPGADLFIPYAQGGARFPTIALRVEPGAEDAVLAAARGAVAELDPELPLYSAGTLAGLVAEDMAAPTFTMMLLGLFAVLAVALAAVGIYGVVAFLVAQRTHEIGVRMALGARSDEVIRLVVWQGLRPALLGAGIGVAGALGAGRLIDGILYGVSATDPLAYAGATVLLLSVVTLATAIPARRASRIPPARALRSE